MWESNPRPHDYKSSALPTELTRRGWSGYSRSVVGVHDGRVVIFSTVTVRGGRITHADTVLDPSKLADLNLVLDT